MLTMQVKNVEGLTLGGGSRVITSSHDGLTKAVQADTIDLTVPGCRNVSRTALAAPVLVNSSFAAPGVHTNVVNRSAPNLFLVQFTLCYPLFGVKFGPSRR